MTFEYRDDWGRRLNVSPDTDHNDQPVVALWSHGEYGASIPVRVPVGRVEEVVAGIRDAARQTTGQDDTDDIGLCGYCGVPRENHHHGYTSTADAIAAAPHRAAPAVGQPAEAQATDEAPLTSDERQFLKFALDLAFDRMVSDSGFTDEDDAALARLRRMAEEARS